MRDKVVYAEVEAAGNRLRSGSRGIVVSPMALEVHIRSLECSVRTAHPAFIPDACLDTVAPPRVTAIAALELCLPGLWDRASDGYVALDFDTIDHLSEGAVRRRLRSALSRGTKACRRTWDVLNRDNFIPL